VFRRTSFQNTGIFLDKKVPYYTVTREYTETRQMKAEIADQEKKYVASKWHGKYFPH
jgi:hypothetical protein